MLLSALDAATTQGPGKPLAGHGTRSIPWARWCQQLWSQHNSSVSTEPGLSPHRRHTLPLSKRYSHLISCRGLVRVNRTSHNSAGVQMKAGWPDKPAKYARAAGFAFVFLLFINVCIYLFFGPRVGRGWEPGVGQTGGLVGFLFLVWLVFLIFILSFKAPHHTLPHAQQPPAFPPAKGLLLLAATSQPQCLAGRLTQVLGWFGVKRSPAPSPAWDQLGAAPSWQHLPIPPGGAQACRKGDGTAAGKRPRCRNPMSNRKKYAGERRVAKLPLPDAVPLR